MIQTPDTLEGRTSRNVSVILSPQGYPAGRRELSDYTSLFQTRDDLHGNPIQLFGGWMKGWSKKNPYEHLGWRNEESVGHTIYREMVDELGLALREVLLLPFPRIEDYDLFQGKSPSPLVYLTWAEIYSSTIGNKRRVEPSEEVNGQLNLREGSSMDLYKLDDSILERNLYDNDRRMIKILLRNWKAMINGAVKIDLRGLQFPREIQEDLEAKIRVRA